MRVEGEGLASEMMNDVFIYNLLVPCLFCNCSLRCSLFFSLQVKTFAGCFLLLELMIYILTQRYAATSAACLEPGWPSGRSALAAPILLSAIMGRGGGHI